MSMSFYRWMRAQTAEEDWTASKSIGGCSGNHAPRSRFSKARNIILPCVCVIVSNVTNALFPLPSCLALQLGVRAGQDPAPENRIKTLNPIYPMSCSNDMTTSAEPLYSSLGKQHGFFFLAHTSRRPVHPPKHDAEHSARAERDGGEGWCWQRTE